MINMFTSIDDEYLLLKKFEDLKIKEFSENMSINYSKAKYDQIIEYHLNISFPNPYSQEQTIFPNTINFILEIILSQKTIHLYSKNLNPISDGRDLLPSLFNTPIVYLNINKLDLLTIIKHLKNFINNLTKQNSFIGKFYLGKEYDISIISNLETLHKTSCFHIDKINNEIINIPSLLCIGNENILLFEYGKISNKNISDEKYKFTLVFYANLTSLTSFRKTMIGSFVSLNFLKNNHEYRIPLKIYSENDDEMEKVIDILIEKIQKKGKQLDIFKKKKGELPKINIKEIENNISNFENEFKNKANNDLFNKLIKEYEQAIEYYSAINDQRYIEYKNKLKELLTDPKNAEFIK